MSEPVAPIDWARHYAARREQQPARKLLDQMSDAELAHLYGERDLAVSLLARVRETSARLINEANARAEQAEAAIERVQETAACWEQMPSDRHVYIHEAARTLRAALTEPKEPRP
ncbi:hypothetical protein [Streptomyces sp. R33]|uniref:Uncharacterized protein n=1 Tax=Streptomyces sp. R33 TaxID=3238629 RepID=A0AB39Y8N7_9ACTN